MSDAKVAILISTMNRPDFIVRTLNYYAKLKSPHPIYLADSSKPESAEIIKSTIDKLKNDLKVYYNWFPPGFENSGKLLSMVKERYAVISGDDDYEVPASLTKCAEFLETNPNYAAAGGQGISFRLNTGGPFGEIKRLTDYPNYSLEANTASQRLIDFLKICFVITFSVNRVEHLKKIWVVPLPIITTWSELFQICYCAVSGKVKLMDCLGVVRQIHDKQYHSNSMVDWLTEKGFHDYYTIFRDHLARKIVEMDNIPTNQAEQAVKDAFWEYLQVHMTNEIKGLRIKNEPTVNRVSLKLLRTKIGTTFPVLKTIYRKHVRPFTSHKRQIHYEVTNPRSPYYKDFRAVVSSFTGKDID